MATPASGENPHSGNSSADGLVGGLYTVDAGRPLPGAGGGVAAYAVADRPDLVALHPQPGRPPRAGALAALTQRDSAAIAGVMAPLAHGTAAHGGYFVICAAPPGPPLSAGLRPWSEGAILDLVLRPAAGALAALAAAGVTHRAIRPDNVFQGAGLAVVLGAAWAAPPASLQPPAFEPPYAAMCLPAGRGEGGIADDVYALGVLLITLALGRAPMAGMDAAQVVRRKLDLGSYAALVGEDRLPGAIADLARGMLAEDPDHRPPPALLADPAAARARRVAARPPRRAQRPLEVGLLPVWDARALAGAIAAEHDAGVRLLRGGLVDGWLRRALGDGGLAARVDEAVRQRAADAAPEDPRADAMLAMRAVALLDPLAPLCWRGVALWPDGLGTALADARETAPEVGARLEDLILNEAVAGWATARAERCDAPVLRLEARQWRGWLRIRGPGGGLDRIAYTLNPLLPCSSPLLGGRAAARLGDLLPALEDAAARPDRAVLGRAGPLDHQVASFLAARMEQRMEGELAALADPARAAEAAMAQLRALARLQGHHQRRLPALAGWLAELVGGSLDTWQHRARRARLKEELAGLAAAGLLGPMLALLDDPAARQADEDGARRAGQAVASIDADLAAIAAGSAARGELARRLGHEIAVGAGLAALTFVLVAAAMS